jgi:acetyltransferase-like isoleucine patch superfamily enzyme
MISLAPAQMLGDLVGRIRVAVSRLWIWEARFRGVTVRGRTVLHGRPIVSLVRGSEMIWEDGITLASSSRANPLGNFQPCVLRTLAPGARLHLGPRVGMSSTAICAGASVEIGEGTILGAGAMVIDNDFHIPTGEWGWATESLANARPVRIGRGVFIGARAIVLKGVTIGDRAVIGAGALVTRDVPAGHMAVGNPARILSSDG